MLGEFLHEKCPLCRQNIVTPYGLTLCDECSSSNFFFELMSIDGVFGPDVYKNVIEVAWLGKLRQSGQVYTEIL